MRLGSLASSFEQAIEADLRELEQSAVITRAPDCVVLKHGFLRSIPAFQRAEVLRRVWRRAGWPEASMSARRWRRLAALVQNDEIPRVEVGARVEVSTERSFLVLRRRPGPASSSAAADALEPIPLAVPGLTAVPWAGGAIDARLDPGPETARGETIDLERVSLPLFVRTAAAGDRFEPLGMGGQSMPLADFFRGRHVRRADRTPRPLVCDQNGIIWVVGHRISDRVKMGEKTRRSWAEWRDCVLAGCELRGRRWHEQTFDATMRKLIETRARGMAPYLAHPRFDPSTVLVIDFNLSTINPRLGSC